MCRKQQISFLFKILRSIFILYCLSLIIVNKIAYSQDGVIDNFSTDASNKDAIQLSTEKLLLISPNKRFFIVDNVNGTFIAGDYVSMLLDNELICRGLVVKVNNFKAAIKISKIYSKELLSILKPNIKIQILKGDDSYFLNQIKKQREDALRKKKSSDMNDVVFQEENLLNSKITNSPIVEKKKNINISSDNVLSAFYVISSKVPASLVGASLQYQLANNFWLEGLYNYGIAKDYPVAGINVDTVISNYGLNIKYTFKAPAYSYILPFVGVSLFSASATDPTVLTAAEQSLIDTLNITSFNIGATLLKRLVPGWFMRADLSLHGVYLGLSLEF